MTARKQKKTRDFTFDELQRWGAERILESLMDGRFREGVSMVIDQTVMWARRNPVRKEVE